MASRAWKPPLAMTFSGRTERVWISARPSTNSMMHDGATLVLAVSEDGEAFEAQCESLSTALAQLGRRLFPPVTERDRSPDRDSGIGSGGFRHPGLAWYVRIGSESCVPALVAGAYGIALAAGAVSVRRWWPERSDLLLGLGWFATPLLASGRQPLRPGRLGPRTCSLLRSPAWL